MQGARHITMDEKENNLLISPIDTEEEPITWRRKFLGIIQRKSNISNINLIVYYLASMLGISLFVYINAGQKYVLEIIGVPKSEQGQASGDLAFCNEIVVLLCSYIWGSLSDLLRSRKLVYMFSFVFMAIGLGLYPLAPTITVLIIFRVVFAIGAAGSASMLTAVLGDYTTISDRGKATGLLGVMSGLGAVIASILYLRFPSWFVQWNFTTNQAAYLSYGIIATFSMIMAGIVLFGLYGNLINVERNINTDQEPKKGILTILKEGIVAAKDPMILISYASSFVARGDSVLITTFITLWVAQEMQAIHSASEPEAISRAGLVSGIAQLFALCAAPFIGFLADRVNRIASLILVALISGIGYTSIYFVPDVTTGIVYLPIALIGIGEIGVIITSQILVTQSAPKDALGGVSGIFSLSGAIGILIATKIGGIIYDKWKPGGVFVMMGAFNFLLCILAIIMFIIKKIQQRREKNIPIIEEVSHDEEIAE